MITGEIKRNNQDLTKELEQSSKDVQSDKLQDSYEMQIVTHSPYYKEKISK
jgi:hypothetical protein